MREEPKSRQDAGAAKAHGVVGKVSHDLAPSSESEMERTRDMTMERRCQ